MNRSLTQSLHLIGLIDGGWKSFDFEVFRKGIEICRLSPEEPVVALLRYEPGASVPKHQHKGLETILVLEGEQSDERGNYPAGSLVFGLVKHRVRCLNTVGKACSVLRGLT